jgi:hypothetical protein
MDFRKFHNKSFCQLESELIESDAVKDLSGKWSLFCLIRFHQKAYRKWKNVKKRGSKGLVITNNGEIIFTYTEAKELGIKSGATFHRVVRELVEDKGFIDIAEHGNWYFKEPTKFAISQRWKRYGTSEYERVRVPRILPHGLGFKKQ